jgi:hypothetical protein
MRSSKATAFVAALFVVCLATPVRAQVCADPDRSGTVTVSDGVNMLRAAAGLSSSCVMQICDVTLDGAVTVTDGVIALREAAQLGGAATCSQAQVADVVNMTQAILETGIGIPGVSSARSGSLVANARATCPDGGVVDVQDTSVRFLECGAGGFVFNGTFTVGQNQNGDAVLTASQFSITEVATGETLTFDANLTATSDGTNTFVNGTLSFASGALGSFSYTLEGVVLTQEGLLTDGTVTVNIQSGTGAFASITSIRLRFLAPVVLADVVFSAGATAAVFIDTSTDGHGVCTPCTSAADCTAGLGCFDCAQSGPKPCTGETARCSVQATDVILECEDGYF